MLDKLLDALVRMDPEARAAAIGGAIWLVMSLAKLIWPRLRKARKVAKFATAVIVAFVAGYASAGWVGGVLAALSALGAYDGSKNLRRLVGGG